MPNTLIDTLMSDPVPVYDLKPTEENELKLITTDGSTKNFKNFIRDAKKGLISGITIVNSIAPQIVLARQIDTEDQILRKNGISLRIRGTYYDDGRWETTDINIKTKKDSDVTMLRGEYEVRIPDPSVVNLPALRQKYEHPLNDGKLPDLEKALDLAHELSMKGKLKEIFLIATSRQRNVLKLDSNAIGYQDNQVFYGEMPNDVIDYIVRSPSLNESRLMHVSRGRSELEMEALHTACDYNPYAGCEDHVCRNLDRTDEDLGILFVEEAVQNYARSMGVEVEKAGKSKAGRGFEALNSYKTFMNSISEETGFKGEFNKNSSGLLVPTAPPLMTPIHNFPTIPTELKAA